jgi:hypothetical protein
MPLLAVVNACIAESEWTPSARSQRYNHVTELVIAAAEDRPDRHYAGADGWRHWSTSCAGASRLGRTGGYEPTRRCSR